MARRRALAHPVSARQTDLAIQLHGVNPPALPATGKGRHTGRVLLRRDGTIPPLPWSSFAPPFASGTSQETPSGAIQDFHICGTSTVIYCSFSKLFVDAASTTVWRGLSQDSPFRSHRLPLLSVRDPPQPERSKPQSATDRGPRARARHRAHWQPMERRRRSRRRQPDQSWREASEALQAPRCRSRRQDGLHCISLGLTLAFHTLHSLQHKDASRC